MTEQTQPTDAELLDAADDFRSQYKHGGTTFDEFDALGFARAVLAKWGTPPAVAGEPVAYRYKFKEDLQWQYTCNKSQAHRLAVVEPLYTTPQPTQAQAGAVPPAPFWRYWRGDEAATAQQPAPHGTTLPQQGGTTEGSYMNEERCQACKFWEHPTHQDDLHDDDKEGRCRRYPAVLIGHDVKERGWACQEASHWSQPVMYAGDWCGEFQAKTVSATPSAPSEQ